MTDAAPGKRDRKGLAIGGAAVLALLLFRGKKGSATTPLIPGGGSFGGGGASGSWEEEQNGPKPAPSGGTSGGSGGHAPAPAPGWWSNPSLPTTGWASTTGVPDSVIARMAKAVATNNPDELERVALELNQEGYNQQAEDLLHAAQLMRKAQAAGTTPTTPGAAAPSGTVPWKPPAPTDPDNTIPVQRPIPPNPLIKQGSSGTGVSTWQGQLRTVGFGSSKNVAANELFAGIPGADSEVVTDGKFGPATDRATRIVQTDYGIKVDGIVGDKTRAALGSQPVLGKRLLKLGTRGPAVKSWQGQLVADGAGAIVPDGMFGNITKTATIAWQKQRGLTADGIVGPATLRAIGTKPANALPVSVPSTMVVDPDKWRTMRRGTAGKDVAEWQMILNRDGFGPITADGKFGPLTEEASKQWQTAHGLKPDGIVGPATRAKIDDNDTGAPGALATRVMGDPQPVQRPRRQMFHAPQDFKAYSPLPGLIPEAVPTEVVPADRSLAAKFAQHMFNVSPGDEDRELVSMFQRAHGLNDTGSYGPGTALALVPYGIVPAKPFYWPRKGLLRVKAGYRLTLLEQSNRDPQRADEWAAAANV